MASCKQFAGRCSRTSRIDEVCGEFAAIDEALSRTQPGDLCLILVVGAGSTGSPGAAHQRGKRQIAGAFLSRAGSRCKPVSPFESWPATHMPPVQFLVKRSFATMHGFSSYLLNSNQKNLFSHRRVKLRR
jgi:hypothetical protein